MPRFPHPLSLLTACILVAAALTYVVPAGEFERRHDPATNRNVVVPGSFHRVPASPLGPMAILVSVPKGIAEAVDVLAVVFLVGGAFAVVDRTGALRVAFAALILRLRSRQALAIPICCLAFAAGGALENMQEEIIALVPALVLMAGQLGFDKLTAVSMSLGAAAVGAAFSPVNPFQVGIAQQVAELPLFSGSAFRTGMLVLALAVWIWGTLRYAERSRAQVKVRLKPDTTYSGGEVRLKPDTTYSLDTTHASTALEASISGHRAALIMMLVAVTFATFIIGLARYGWGFSELSALFFAMGVVAGLVGGLGVEGTADGYVQGFRDMALAALLIGFARAISVVLTEGHIIDTIVNALVTPLGALPAGIAALGMIAVHTAVHVPVPSVSGHAVLTMPILVPLSDLLGIGRQVTVLAYQCGAGLCELITPTNGALMAVLVAADVRYDEWIRFALPMWIALTVLGAASILVAMGSGLLH